MAGKYDRSIGLCCSTCGSDQFEFEPDSDGPVRCTGCDRLFVRAELMRENGERIENEVDELKKEVLADLTKQLRGAFSGNKHIKFRL